MHIKKNFRSTTNLLAVAAAGTMSMAIASSPAHAQQSAVTNDDGEARGTDKKVQQIEVRGSLDAYNPRRDDTAAKILVNHDEIVKYGDTNVLDVLKRVPGVTVSGNGGRGGEVRMRGLGGYTQVLINGEKTPPDFTLDSLAPDLIERIEVLRAASAEFSTQSIAGTINIVLKKTIKSGQRELKLGYATGDANANVGPNVDLQLADKAGRLAWALTGAFQRQHYTHDVSNLEQHVDSAGNLDGLRLGRLPDNGRFTSYNLSPRLVWDLEHGDTLTSQTYLNINRFQSNTHPLIDTQIGPLPAYPDLDQSMSNEGKMLREELDWAHNFDTGAKLDAKLSGTVTAASNAIFRTGNGSPITGALHQLIQSNAITRGLTSTGKFTTANWEGHALAFGWDAGYEVEDDARRDRDYDHPEVALPGSDESYTGEVSRLAVYSQDEWNVTPRWSVYLGARWEGIFTRVEGNTFYTIHNRSTVLSPLLQTLYKLPSTKGDQLRLAVTRTYKAPDLQRLIPHSFTSANNSPTEPDVTGNPNVKPELALGVDVAWERYWAEGALVSVSTSLRNIDHSVRDQVSFEGGRWVSRPLNTGHARARGLEFEAKFPLNTVIKTTMSLDLRASLSRNWSSVDAIPGPNNRLTNQTPVAATLGADYHLGRLTAGGSFVFKNGGQVQVSAQQVSYESVRRDLDLYALWKLDAKCQLRVAASNVLGQDYSNESSYTLVGDGTQRSRTTYPASRTVRATLELKF